MIAVVPAVNRSFEAEAALRELERLHEWVERQRRNLRRIKDLDEKTDNTATGPESDDGVQEEGAERKDYPPKSSFPY
jgi:hypothetical protein